MTLIFSLRVRRHHEVSTPVELTAWQVDTCPHAAVAIHPRDSLYAITMDEQCAVWAPNQGFPAYLQLLRQGHLEHAGLIPAGRHCPSCTALLLHRPVNHLHHHPAPHPLHHLDALPAGGMPLMSQILALTIARKYLQDIPTESVHAGDQDIVMIPEYQVMELCFCRPS